jgi:hypothetical protein
MKRAALIALIFVACHHEAAKEPVSIKAQDPCTLISTAELSRVTGIAVNEPTADGDENTVRRCTWLESGETAAGSIMVAIHVIDMDLLVARVRNLPNDKLSELGDEAYWSNALNQLTMRTNNGIVTINFNTSGGATDHKAAAIEIAKVLLPKLT